MTDHQILEKWYHYAARADGFIGGALRNQRAKAFVTQEQQRAIIGILDGQYDSLWLRLQAMPLPRFDQFQSDLARIVVKVQANTEIAATIDLAHLEEIIQSGLG